MLALFRTMFFPVKVNAFRKTNVRRSKSYNVIQRLVPNRLDYYGNGASRSKTMTRLWSSLKKCTISKNSVQTFGFAYLRQPANQNKLRIPLTSFFSATGIKPEVIEKQSYRK